MPTPEEVERARYWYLRGTNPYTLPSDSDELAEILVAYHTYVSAAEAEKLRRLVEAWQEMLDWYPKLHSALDELKEP